MKKLFALAAVAVAAVFYIAFEDDGKNVHTRGEIREETQEDTFVFTYRIQKGDSLSLIADRFGIDLQTLENANIVKDGVIYEGDILGVPLNRKAVAFIHTVSSGETFSSVALAYGTTAESIMKLNGTRSDKLMVSEKILVSRFAGAPARFVVFEVGENDTGSDISNVFKIDLKEIESMNSSNPEPWRPGSHIVVDTQSYAYSERTRESIIQTARSYLGAPYKYGGNSTETGIDCSAYVKKVFSFFGVNLPRTVRMMHKHADGMWIKKDRLQKGDLVFFETDRPFPSHIGIYIEDGKFIHASSVGGKVIISDLAKPYYTAAYIGAKRIYLQDRNAVAYDYKRSGQKQ